jgi:hypothetical protein
MPLNEEGFISRVSIRHSVSPDAVRTILRALRSGGGSMAQFSHPDFGGMSQWSIATAAVARSAASLGATLTLDDVANRPGRIGSVQAGSASSCSSSHSSICVAAIVLFGKWGLSVPALTFGVSANFAFANFLASSSLLNVSVTLANARFPGLGSNETYHVPWDLLAMMLSRPAGGSAPWAGPQSKANEIVPLATCQPSGFVFRVGRCPGKAPEQRRTSGDPGVVAGQGQLKRPPTGRPSFVTATASTVTSSFAAFGR